MIEKSIAQTIKHLFEKRSVPSSLKHYDRFELVSMPKEVLEVINQFENSLLNRFFLENEINVTNDYYDVPCIKKVGNYLLIHDQIKFILVHYLMKIHSEYYLEWTSKEHLSLNEIKEIRSSKFTLKYFYLE